MALSPVAKTKSFMKGILIKNCLVIICFCSIFYSYGQNPDFKHLEVKFLKIVQPYSNSSIGATESFKKRNSKTMLKLNLINNGKTHININFNNVYALDRLNNAYPVYFSNPLASKKKTIKPHKSLKHTLFFDFPHNQQPVILMIEDRKFRLYE